MILPYIELKHNTPRNTSLKLLDEDFRPWERSSLRLLLRTKGAIGIKVDEYWVIRKDGFIFYTTPYFARVMLSEWKVWEKYYLPPFSLKGKTVLDVGAGCGETAIFFAKHGASKVVVVEKEREYEKFLKVNLFLNRINHELYLEAFDPEKHMKNVDFIKMDIEGGERVLADKEINIPMVLEAHGEEMKKLFLKKGFKAVRWMGRDVWLMNNFLKLK